MKTLAAVVAVLVVGCGAPENQAAGPAPTWADPSTVRPAEQLWPHAVRRLPLHLPDGRGYTLTWALADNRYLVLVRRGEQGSELLLWDVDAGTSVSLGNGGPVTADDRHIVWSTATGDQGELWSASVDGTNVRKVATVETSEGATFFNGASGLTIVGTDIVFSYGEGTLTGLHRVPLAGGTPEPVPGGAMYRMLWSEPWAHLAGQHGRLSWWNVATGERRTAEGPQVSWGQCSHEWCISTEDFVGKAQRVGGTEVAYAPVVYGGTSFSRDGHVTIGGTYQVGPPPAVGPTTAPPVNTPSDVPIWDISTGQVGLCQPQPGRSDDPDATMTLGHTCSWYHGNEFVYLDLDLIHR